MKLFSYEKNGPGEVIRYILVQAGEPFEDVRLQNVKDLPGAGPYNSLPVLELDDGKRLGGTLAIAQYLGEKYGMSFEGNSFHRAQLNNMCETTYEIVSCMGHYWSETDSDRRQEKKKEIMEKVVPPKLASINQKLKESHSTSGLCCNHVTYADFFVFFLFHDVLTRAYSKESGATEGVKYPEVRKLCQAVGSLPNIKKYLEANKDIDFSVPV